MKTTRDKRAFQPSLEHYKKAVTDELECTICSHWYDDHQRKPKLIPGCGHTICLVCIKDIMRSNGGVRFRCPFDQKVYDIDNGDPETLTNNITLMGMLDLSEGSLAKKSMHKSINLLKERIETLQGKETKFNEYRSIFLASIHNHFDQAMEYVEEERKRLTDEFDEACEMTREGTPALSLLDEMKKCLQSAEQLLEQDTETLVDQAPDMLEKIYTYNMEDIEDIQNQDVELKFNFLPEKFTGSLGEIEVTKLLVVNQDVSVSRVKSLQKIVWLFISTMLISLHVRFEPYINSRYAIAVRYYTFKYPIISKLRSVFASYLDDPSYTVCSFVEDLTFLYVTLGFWGACASLGHYYCLFLKFEEMRNETCPYSPLYKDPPLRQTCPYTPYKDPPLPDMPLYKDPPLPDMPPIPLIKIHPCQTCPYIPYKDPPLPGMPL
ncbi:predicted protein [Nematostella vectensis]|uniref:RING-type domain-containing protein n=1 Tax=Nematostella vectensis TaxID=45351 RepID=A7S8N9_NEMVE|nr:predicted protein [Nematostella vectensis]|eukprot:XP_001631921.1 predicted protein [Nematostella vectensis]